MKSPIVFKIFDQPEAEAVPHTNRMRLTEDFCFYYNGKAYWIPAGFTWDGASIPRAVWSIIGAPSEPDFWAATLVHDWVYLTHIFSRAETDEALFQILGESDVSLWRRRCIWAAVRAFGGGSHWKNGVEEKKQIDELNSAIAGRPDRDKFGYPLSLAA